MTDKKIIYRITFLFLLWRFLLFGVSLVSLKILSFRESFPYINSHLKKFGSPLLWSQANFDGVHYLRIAQEGYQAQFSQAFFPLYPLVVKILNFFFNNYLLSGLLISHLSFLIGLFFFYKLALSLKNETVAQKATLALLCFPTSFFFLSFYSESLFFLFLILTFYTLQHKKTLISVIFANLASATRFIGFFIFPAAILKIATKKHQKSIFLFLIPFGLLFYLIFLWIKFNHPFLFFSSLSLWQKSTITFPAITVFRYLKMISILPKINWQFFSVCLEFIVFLFFSITTIISFFKVPAYLFLYNLLTFCSFIFLGTFSSLPRYVLALFPSFLVLGQVKNKIFYPMTVCFAILQALSYFLFFRGYWVA